MIVANNAASAESWGTRRMRERERESEGMKTRRKIREPTFLPAMMSIPRPIQLAEFAVAESTL